MRRRVEAVWKDIAPDVPFEAEFSEQIVGELYETEAARAQTLAAFALLDVVVACLGLFGLAAFTDERRPKELGVRNVLGDPSHAIALPHAWQDPHRAVQGTSVI